VEAVAREAPTDGLVAPAERTSVVAQVEVPAAARARASRPEAGAPQADASSTAAPGPRDGRTFVKLPMPEPELLRVLAEALAQWATTVRQDHRREAVRRRGLT